MHVTDAIRRRHSTRAFTAEPVSRATVEELLDLARWAPTGGNLQPWKVYVTAGEVKDRLIARVAEQLVEHPLGKPMEYDIYPKGLKEPYFTRRARLGEMMYEKLGVARSDRPGRLAQYAQNWRFFGAPVGLFFTLDRAMEPGQWADVGMFMQSLMLLACERGLATCPQESWAAWHETVREVLPIPPEEILFCGMALGHAADDAAVNTLRAERVELSEFASFHGL
jgi:nitroreductase